ncbi:hypothetical protein [Burkholderia vietnamiensis]|uniref:hypothetical protein n=1 Tax=Burkholderia vietnamiensis TaxID=60552 RepID=UPI001CF5E5CC|nr:hypothetical protein [Burkholderia vietnamiensis]MCA8206641.1 hypothetical protein [Burkholderia vietnamiensis]
MTELEINLLKHLENQNLSMLKLIKEVATYQNQVQSLEKKVTSLSNLLEDFQKPLKKR